MAENAKFIDKSGNERIVTAKEAICIPKYERNFRCIGTDFNGYECGCALNLSRSKKGTPYFRGDNHISGCSLACQTPEITMYIDSLNDLDIDEYLHAKKSSQPKAPPKGPSGGKGPNEEDPDFDDDDDTGIIVEKPKKPKSVRILYQLLRAKPYDYRVGREHLVGDILVIKDTILTGFCDTLEGFKVMMVKRCDPSIYPERTDNQIIVRMCETEPLGPQYLVMTFTDIELLKKVWKNILSKPKNNSRPQMLVSARVSHLKENIWKCDIVNPNMVSEYK